jgi:hypothetical protein
MTFSLSLVAIVCVFQTAVVASTPAALTSTTITPNPNVASLRFQFIRQSPKVHLAGLTALYLLSSTGVAGGE